MFGLAMLLFSYSTLEILDKLHMVVVREERDKNNTWACFFIAVIIGIFSELGIRMIAR